jgi:hypothetical protein
MASNDNHNIPFEGSDSDLKDGSVIHRVATAGTVSMSPQLFEKLYLSPQNKVSGSLRGQFGNPTPL